MRVEPTPLKDCFIIHEKVYSDARGYFIEAFNARDFKEINELSLVFDNIESRISSQPQVNFEIISVVQNSNYVETIMGVTKPFDVINYAKLINKTTKTNNMSNLKNEILQLIEEFKGTQLPHKQNPYHPDSDTCSGLIQFEKWLNLKL